MAWNLAPANKALFSFRDIVGRKSTVGVFVNQSANNLTSAELVALKNGLKNVSDAALDTMELQLYATTDTPGVPVEDAFDRPTDKLLLELKAADGSKTTIKLPSLRAQYYDTDMSTPDTSDEDVAALLNAIKDTCVSADGKELTAITRARRMVPQGLKSWNKKGAPAL